MYIVTHLGGSVAAERSTGTHKLRCDSAPDGQDPAGHKQLQTGLTTAARRWDHTNEPGQVGSLRGGITAGAVLPRHGIFFITSTIWNGA